MLIRALLILLIVLNLGVAIWWVARGDDAGEAPIVQLEGVTRLRLLSEGASAAVSKTPTSTPVPATAPAATTPPPVAETPPAQTVAAAPQTQAPVPAPATPAPAEPMPPATPAPAAARCYAFGPFENAEQAKEARAQLQSQVMRLRERASTPTARGWRVTMAVPGNRDAAQAVAARIAAAGFDDFFITADGDASSVIALGRYGSERAARNRESALHAAGFGDARAEPLGGGAEAQIWIDVLAPTAFEANAARRVAGATRADAIDCAKVP
jgi:type IV secretory pathway VirB10-like protein